MGDGRGMTPRIGLISGLLALALIWLLVLLDPEFAPAPLTAFGLSPVIASGAAGPLVVLALTASATASGIVAGWGEWTPPELAFRVAIIVFVGLWAAGTSRVRERMQREKQVRDEALALSHTLEEGLVPATTVLPGDLRVATFYRPEIRGLAIGGDFYDIVALADGSIAFVIGDVVGNGPRAAAHGAAVRASWRAVVMHDEHAGPQGWLQTLNRLEIADSAAVFTTACTGLLSPDRGHLRIASAGHAPPLFKVSSEPTRELGISAGLPLGIMDQPYADRVIAMPECWALVVYTDGLVEGRKGLRSGGFGTAELSASIDRATSLGPQWIDALIAEAMEVNGSDFADDVAIVALASAPALDEPRTPSEGDSRRG